jgi:hypothetical protein
LTSSCSYDSSTRKAEWITGFDHIEFNDQLCIGLKGQHKRLTMNFFLIALLSGIIIGCGGNSIAPKPPTTTTCTGVSLSGTMQDSLTNQPVFQGWAILESGTQLSTTSVYNFSQIKRVTTDAHGFFSLCTPAIAKPSAIVLVALDSSGETYPPFVANVSDTNDLGFVLMGGCRVTCGFDNQQQTSLPVTIKGNITSAPTAKIGSVMAQYTMNALDGSKNLWNFAVPPLDPSQSNLFGTTPSACTVAAPLCAEYAFTLPSQKPIQRVTGGYLQEAGAPNYSIYATVDGTPSCASPFDISIFQQDGTSLLTGTPGAQLSAADINFTGCE